jgi:hypothetical protein
MVVSSAFDFFLEENCLISRVALDDRMIMALVSGRSGKRSYGTVPTADSVSSQGLSPPANLALSVGWVTV